MQYNLRPPFKLGVVIFTAIFAAPFLAAAHNPPDCSDLLADHATFLRNLVRQSEIPGSLMKLVVDSQELDAQSLGQEGQEIFNQLERLMVGHTDAKLTIARAVQRAVSGTQSKSRPLGIYLLLGITGTGKTMLGKALAEALNGDPDKLLFISSGDYQHDHEISKLTGAPAGYLGHSSTPAKISQESLDEVTSSRYGINLMIIDELEKGSQALQRLLLGIMDSGKMTTGTNQVVNFTNTIVILTSNLGQKEMQELLSEQRFKIGFQAPPSAKTQKEQQDLSQSLDEAAQAATAKFLSPEFRNRLDQTFVFKQYNEDEIRKVLDNTLASSQRRIFLDGEGARLIFHLSDSARDLILNQFYKPEFGGRSIRRGVEKLVIEPLTNLLGNGKLKNGDVVTVSPNKAGTALSFQQVASHLETFDMHRLYEKIYGHSFWPTPPENDETEIENARPVTYSDLLYQLAKEKDPDLQTRLILDYIYDTKRLSDDAFLQLYELLPRKYAYGYRQSQSIVLRMEKEKLGGWKEMPFEPSVLRFYWTGLDRLKSIRDSNRSRLRELSEDLANQLYYFLLEDQQSDKDLVLDVVNFVEILHRKSLQLPSRK